MINIIGIDFESIVDGEGVRVVVFFSGCKHDCKGCHNPASHNFEAGRPFTDELQNQIIEYISATPFVSGVTLSGGDPMYSADEAARFVRKIKAAIPAVTVWIYSGFTYEEIVSDPERRKLLQLCDVLVDGPFILSQRDPTIAYRGSKNQRIIDIKKTQQAHEVILFDIE